jgi:hypothetical protein
MVMMVVAMAAAPRAHRERKRLRLAFGPTHRVQDRHAHHNRRPLARPIHHGPFLRVNDQPHAVCTVFIGILAGQTCEMD